MPSLPRRPPRRPRTALDAALGCLLVLVLVLVRAGATSAASLDTDAASTTDTTNTAQPPPPPTTIAPPAAPVPVSEEAPTRGAQTPRPAAPADHRRPIWNIAHMVNSIKELDYRLAKGANAIEADVTFSSAGEPLHTYHGPPCDCMRHCHQSEDLVEFLDYLREISIDESAGGETGANLTLVLLDLKLTHLDQGVKAHAGVSLAHKILDHLYSSAEAFHGRRAPKRLPLVVSINHVADAELVNHFVYTLERRNASHLLEHIGFDVGMGDPIATIEAMWRRFGRGLNLWQGDGFTNCLSPFLKLERLSQAIGKRNSRQGYPSKVYQWTVDLHDRMREALLMGTDAIMTNHPERLLSVLGEPELAHNYRLATLDDDPFVKFIAQSSWRNGEMARHQRSASPMNGGLLGGLMDLLSSWIVYLREIPFLSLPTTFVKTARSSSTASRVRATAQRPGPAPPSAASPQPAQYLQPIRTPNATTDNPSAGTTQSEPKGPTRGPQPEYQVDGLDLRAPSGEHVSFGESVEHNLVAAGDQTSPAPDTLAPYSGPKWYTSLVSNLLVSALKILLPEPTS